MFLNNFYDLLLYFPNGFSVVCIAAPYAMIPYCKIDRALAVVL